MLSIRIAQLHLAKRNPLVVLSTSANPGVLICRASIRAWIRLTVFRTISTQHWRSSRTSRMICIHTHNQHHRRFSANRTDGRLHFQTLQQVQVTRRPSHGEKMLAYHHRKFAVERKIEQRKWSRYLEQSADYAVNEHFETERRNSCPIFKRRCG